MTKQEIITALRDNHKQFIALFEKMPEAQFLACPPQKWTNGQHLEHILRSVNPLALILQLPKFLVKMLFGKSNRPSKTYAELVAKYQDKLAQGGKAMGRFIPKSVSFKQKNGLSDTLVFAISRLIKSLDKYSEADLDTFIIPHPLLGKLTLREMMFFTIYHVTHHQKSLTA